MTAIKCAICGKPPEEIDEYVYMAASEQMTPEEFVRAEEGTFDPESGMFLCTVDYIRAGSPSGWPRWRATTENVAALHEAGL